MSIEIIPLEPADGGPIDGETYEPIPIQFCLIRNGRQALGVTATPERVHFTACPTGSDEDGAIRVSISIEDAGLLGQFLTGYRSKLRIDPVTDEIGLVR